MNSAGRRRNNLRFKNSHTRTCFSILLSCNRKAGAFCIADLPEILNGRITYGIAILAAGRHLHKAGRLLPTQCLLTARRRTAYRRLRPEAASLSEKASSGIVFQPADRRDAGRAPRRHRGASAGTLSSVGRTIRRLRGRDGEVEGQRTAVVGAEDERHPKPSERDRDAGNCIWVTSKRGSMASACFVCRKE